MLGQCGLCRRRIGPAAARCGGGASCVVGRGAGLIRACPRVQLRCDGIGPILDVCQQAGRHVEWERCPVLAAGGQWRNPGCERTPCSLLRGSRHQRQPSRQFFARQLQTDAHCLLHRLFGARNSGTLNGWLSLALDRLGQPSGLRCKHRCQQCRIWRLGARDGSGLRACCRLGLRLRG